MTAYALTHSTSWAAGVVGAPVTDWRDYDTIYTERLMKLPKNNVDGYKRTAPRFAADRLQGRLLLIHGTMDDNVHMQNTVQFAYELQRAGAVRADAHPAATRERSAARSTSAGDVRLTMRILRPGTPPATTVTAR
jgi:dipeptidyl aminopeptidase/acylaminoacyl peptidase